MVILKNVKTDGEPDDGAEVAEEHIENIVEEENAAKEEHEEAGNFLVSVAGLKRK